MDRHAGFAALLVVLGCYESHPVVSGGSVEGDGRDEVCPWLEPHPADGFCVEGSERHLPALTPIELEVIAHVGHEHYLRLYCAVRVDHRLVEVRVLHQAGSESWTDERCHPFVPGPACTGRFPLEPRSVRCPIPPLEPGEWTVRFGERDEPFRVTSDPPPGPKTCWGWSAPHDEALEEGMLGVCVGENECGGLELTALVSDCPEAQCRSSIGPDGIVDLALERPSICAASDPHIHPCWASWHEEGRSEAVTVRVGGELVTLTGDRYTRYWCVDLTPP